MRARIAIIFLLRAAIPVEPDAIVACLSLSLTVDTVGFLFSAETCQLLDTTRGKELGPFHFSCFARPTSLSVDWAVDVKRWKAEALTSNHSVTASSLLSHLVRASWVSALEIGPRQPFQLRYERDGSMVNVGGEMGNSQRIAALTTVAPDKASLR